ncbi:MAG: hypothetical protein H0U33_04510 [Solirubrobacterales bacterium]|nr:hypothetical protein [Solirubrobacterales bacterium]
MRRSNNDAPHQRGEAGVAQRVSRQLKARRGRDELHVAVGRASGQPPAGPAHEQRGLAVGRDTIGELADLGVPLTQAELAAEYAADRATLDEALERYRAQRDKVDAVVAGQLPG